MKALYVDPFSASNQANPEPFQSALHTAGPIASLPQYGVYATGRFDVAKAVLNNPACFASREGVGLTGNRAPLALAEGPAKVQSTRTPMVEMDGTEHLRHRALVEGVLDASTIKSITGEFLDLTRRLVHPLIDRPPFDAVGDLVISAVLKVFPDAYGVEQDGRENLTALAELSLNSLGPRNDTVKKAATDLPQLEQWIQGALPVETMSEEKIARRIYVAALRSGVSTNEAKRLIRAVLVAAVDTTVAGICNTLYCLSRHPDQWSRIRLNPELAVKAFEEGTRLEAPIQMCYRCIASDCDLQGMSLRGGTRIMVHIGAACHDLSFFREPHQFDLDRRQQHSLAFGAGPHRCLGMRWPGAGRRNHQDIGAPHRTLPLCRAGNVLAEQHAQEIHRIMGRRIVGAADKPMNTAEAYLLTMALIFGAPYLLWRIGRTDYVAPLVVVQILTGIALGPSVFGAWQPEAFQAVFTPAVIQLLNGIAMWAVMILVWTGALSWSCNRSGTQNVRA